MSKIEELIEKSCPNGVEYKQLKEVCNNLQKGTLKVSELIKNGKYPVINAGRNFYGYYNKFNNDCEAITFSSRGEYAGIVNYFNGKFWAGGLCYPYIVRKIKVLNCRFLFYYLKSQENNIMNNIVEKGSIPALNKKDIEKLKIPVPPIDVQKEIVKILDNFSELTTELTTELTAELTARKQQYEYYRDKLLTFDKDDTTVKFVKLGDCCDISAGGDIDKDKYSIEKNDNYCIPLISNGIGKNAIYGYTNISKINKPAVTISARGTIGYAEFRNYPYYPIIRLLSVIPINIKILDTKFLYYLLKGKTYNIPQSGIAQLTSIMLKKQDIFIPPLEKQKEIVDILDKFDALVNDITKGLPAEIEARQKQYEFYRDKLLIFKELKQV